MPPDPSEWEHVRSPAPARLPTGRALRYPVAIALLVALLAALSVLR